jgi:hypothetical protein
LKIGATITRIFYLCICILRLCGGTFLLFVQGMSALFVLVPVFLVTVLYYGSTVLRTTGTNRLFPYVLSFPNTVLPVVTLLIAHAQK